MSVNCEQSLPYLLKDRTFRQSPSRQAISRALKYIDRWRQWMYQSWRIDGENEPSDAVDDLIAITILLHYCTPRFPKAGACIGTLRDGQSWHTSEGIAQACRETLPNLIGRILFAQDTFTSVEDVPEAIRSSNWVESVCGILSDLFDGRPLPVWFFGDLHQLCVARPLESDLMGNRRGRSEIRYNRGIHYTPAPVVDYLVARTFADREFDPKDSAPVVLDPSCGTGNILLASLRLLCHVHTPSTPSLNMAKRLGAQLQVLCHSIAGRDIDERAIAWARRGLILQTCEDCWDAINDQDATSVIRCLNTHVCAVDFLAPPDRNDTRLGDGDVDYIIGGPPFVRLSQLRQTQSDRIEDYQRRYKSARGQFDLYMLFIEESLRRLSKQGRMGLSVANTFLRSSSGRALRELLGEEAAVLELVEFEDSKLYPDAVTQILLLFAERGRCERSARHIWIKSKAPLRTSLEVVFRTDGECGDITPPDCTACRGPDWSLHAGTDSKWLKMLHSAGPPLSTACRAIRGGWSSGVDDVFILRRIAAGTDPEITMVQNRKTREEHQLESRWLRPILHGRDVHGYSQPCQANVVIWPFDHENSTTLAEILRAQGSNVWAYLSTFQNTLESARCAAKTPWYCPRTAPASVGQAIRLLGAKVTSGAGFTVVADEKVVAHNTLLEIVPGDVMDPWLLMAILNSSIFWRYVQMTMPTMGHGRHVLRMQRVKSFPLPSPQSWIGRDAEAAAKLAQTAMASQSNSEQNPIRQNIDSIIEKLYNLS